MKILVKRLNTYCTCTRESDNMHKTKNIVSTAAFLILVLFFLLSIALLTNRIQQEVPDASSGYTDLSRFNFNEKLAYISHSSFEYYRNALYTPEDFKLGQKKNEAFALSEFKRRFDPGNYGTYRIILKLPDNKVYGLSSYSAMYSQRLFINGKEYSVVGIPGKTEETTVPQTNHYTVYFTPEDTQVEIVIQFANYNHADFGGIVPLYLGLQDKITERDEIIQQRIHILVGCTITAFLFFLGMFFFFHRRFTFLWFSLACLSIGLRMLIVDEKAIMLLLPDLPWRISIGMEYLTLIILLFTFLMYINSMFQGAMHKTALWAFGAICVVFAIIVILTPPIIYTRFILWFQLIAMVFGLYAVIAIVYNVVRKKDNRHTEHVLVFIGAFIFIILSILDIQLHRSSGYSRALGLSETGMIVLIFVNMIALALQFSHTEDELNKALRSEHEMQETNLLLDKMSRLKSDFQANISHEMRTPLTIMASYADLTAMQIKRDAINENTIDNLAIIKREAIRLANMVEQLKQVSLEKERQLALVDIKAIALLQQAADFCNPICLKNKNRISVCAESGEILLRVNAESIFQTMINLIINANRHTKGGTIRLNAENCDTELQTDFVKITVSDDGEGIDPKLLPDLFQRGVSGDDSSGLGLAICKEIIEEHGGEIWIESQEGKGTAVQFTLPCSKGVKYGKS